MLDLLQTWSIEPVLDFQEFEFATQIALMRLDLERNCVPVPENRLEQALRSVVQFLVIKTVVKFYA